MEALLESLIQFGHAVADLASSLASVLLPWTPLAAWLVFWLFAVNWTKYREVLAKGGWIGIVLIGAVMVLVWGSVSPDTGETSDFFGLHVSHYVAKTVYVTGLFCLMFLAGSLQLSGFCAGCCQFEEPALEESHAHGDHGHGGQGHDDHGHAGHH